MLDFEEYIESLFAVLVSLQLFSFEVGNRCPEEDVLAFITKASDRAPHLEYFHVWYTKDCYWMRIGGQ